MAHPAAAGGGLNKRRRRASAVAMNEPKFQGTDYYEIEDLLEPEERRRATRRGSSSTTNSCRSSREHFRDGTFPTELTPRLAELGFFGPTCRGVRLRRAEQRRLRPDQPGARARRLRPALVRQRAVGAGDVPDPRLRLRGAEAPLAAAPGARRGDRLLRPHRAGLRLQPRRHAHARAARAAAASS